MSFACRRLMTGQRNWIVSGDFSASPTEEDARPIWTTVERDLRKRRVWVGSSPVFGMTSMIPMSGCVRTRVMVPSVCGGLVDAPDAGGRKGG